MNASVAGTPAKPSKASRQATHMFTTSGVVSLVGIPAKLNELGLKLSRAHYKPADAQLMLVFERGASELTDEQAAELFGKYLGLVGIEEGFSHVVKARNNPAIPATSDIHRGVPEHILLSCSGATPRLGTETELRFSERQDQMLAAIPQVRLSLNLPADVAENVPSWVTIRG